MKQWCAQSGSNHFWNIYCTADALHCGNVSTGLASVPSCDSCVTAPNSDRISHPAEKQIGGDE